MRQSGFTSLAAAASIAAGLLLDVVIAAVFGAGARTDAFFVAARAPLGLTAVAMVGANQALVPMFSTWLVRKERAETSRLMSAVLTVALLATGALAVLLALAAIPLIRVTAPGLGPEQVALAATMVRAMLIIVPLVTAAEILRAYLNARQVVVGPAAMHVVLNATAIMSVLAYSDAGVSSIAWGYVAGAVAQLALITGLAWRHGFRYRWGLRLRDPELRAAGQLCVRPLAAAGLNPLARVGEQLFISFLPAGSITILNYGYRLISAIGGSVFFRSVIVALLPRLTAATAREDSPEVVRLTRLGLRIMLAASLPLTAFMAVLAEPAALAVFRRGNFGRTETTLLGLVLAVYAGSLVGSAVQRALLAPAFARLDTRTPLRNTVYGVVANLALLPPLMWAFGLGAAESVVAIPLAYTLAQYVNVAHAWYRLRGHIQRPFAGLGRLTAALAIASAAAGGAMVSASVALDLSAIADRRLLLAATAVVAAGGAAVLGAILAMLSGAELRRMWAGLRAGRRGARVPSTAPESVDHQPGSSFDPPLS